MFRRCKRLYLYLTMEGAEAISVFEDVEPPVSSGRLVTLVNFFIFCSGGCCFNVFGKRNTEETTETRSFDNPIARLGENADAIPMSAIDVRALDPIVFEPLPAVNVLTTPLPSTLYNNQPRLDPHQLHLQNHLRQATVSSHHHPSSSSNISNVLRSNNNNNDSMVRNNNNENNVFDVKPPGDEPIKVSASSSSQWITFSSSSNDSSNIIVNNDKSVTSTKTTTTTTTKKKPLKLLVEENDFLNPPSSATPAVPGKKGSSQLLGVSITITAPTPSPGISLVVIPPTPTPIPIEKSQNSMVVASTDTTVNSVSAVAATPTVSGTPTDGTKSDASDGLEADIESIPVEVSVSTFNSSPSNSIVDDEHQDSVLIVDRTIKESLPRDEEKEKVAKRRKSHPLYRRTSTPNHETESDRNESFSSENSSFFLQNPDVFEDFSMELTSSVSPIAKNHQVMDCEWQPTLNENESLVMMGASDEHGLKPYQRITTELENEYFQPEYELEPGSFNLTMDDNISTDVQAGTSLFSFSSSQVDVDVVEVESDQPISLTVSGTFDTILDDEHQKQSVVPRKLVFDDSSLLESVSTGEVVHNNASEGMSNDGSSWATITSNQKSSETDGDVDRPSEESGAAGFTFLDALNVTPFSNVGPSAPSTVIKSTTLTSNVNLRRSMSENTEPETGSQFDEGIGGINPPTILFSIGKDNNSIGSDTLHGSHLYHHLVDSGPASRDKFVEDIEAAAEVMGSLVLTDLEENNPTAKVVKETREIEEESYEEGIGKIQRGNLFGMSSQQDDLSDGVENAAHENDSEFTTDKNSEVEENGGEISYLALNHSVEIVKDRLDNSRTLLISDLDDSDNEDEDVNADDESICRDIKDFVPSKWNQNLAPVYVRPTKDEEKSVPSHCLKSSSIMNNKLL